MQTTLVSTFAPLRHSAATPQGRSHEPGVLVHGPAAASDDAFVEMLGAYRCSGGLARFDEVVTLLERGGLAGVVTLARWTRERRVISFEWQQQAWLPWFQFRRADHQPDPALRAVLAELGSVYDGWELAHWFARPNSALAGGAPLQLLGSSADAVLQAARADRYVANG